MGMQILLGIPMSPPSVNALSFGLGLLPFTC